MGLSRRVRRKVFRETRKLSRQFLRRSPVFGHHKATAGSGKGEKPPNSKSMEREVLALVNSTRKSRRLRSLTINSALTSAAKNHSLDQARRRKMSHRGGDGSDVAKRIRKQGYNYRYAGENVAYGQRTAEQVFSSWMRSRGHRKNILDPNVRNMGLYVAMGRDGRLYWTQVFGAL